MTVSGQYVVDSIAAIKLSNDYEIHPLSITRGGVLMGNCIPASGRVNCNPRGGPSYRELGCQNQTPPTGTVSAMDTPTSALASMQQNFTTGT